MAKYGLLGDAAFFAWLEKNHTAVFALEAEPLTHAVETSVKAKAGIVGRDETEQGERALLNLGHTFGHAFEAWCGYSDRLLHGEAIAIGMAIAFRFSAALGYCDCGCRRSRRRPLPRRRAADAHRRDPRRQARYRSHDEVDGAGQEGARTAS